MAIKNIKARLEGSYRLIRIKRIKTIFFIIQLIIALVLGLVVSYLLGLNLDPLYFPLDHFTFIFLILVLIISVESVYFKGLEIKYTRNKSRRYLLARNAIRRSAVIISICGLLIFMLLLPYSHEYILDTYQVGDTDNIGAGNSSIYVFNTQDNFGLVRTSSIRVNFSEPCGIYISHDDIHKYNPQAHDPLDISDNYTWTDLIGISNTQSEVMLFVTNNQTIDVTLNYEVTSEVSPFITPYLPAMGLAFIIVQFIAITIMSPIKRAYASSSIYSKKYVAKTEAGEYRISSEEIIQDDDEEQALLDSTLDLETPPAPAQNTKRAVPPPPAEEVEMARTKGRVDDNLIDEPDVKCANCEEINSAHSALCFSCGSKLLGVKEKAMDPEVYLHKGMNFASAGKYEDAIICYDEILKYECSHVKALVQKGLSLHRLGKWGSAIQYVNTALKLDSNHIEAMLLKAEILEGRDRLDKSIETYSQILTIDPENVIAQSRMAQVSEAAALESVEDVLEQFMCIPGVGLARATTIYDAGFTSIETLKKASGEQLASLKGISKGLAKKIKKGL